MPKQKTSNKQDFCLDDMPIAKLKPGIVTEPCHPGKIFKDHTRVGDALLECLVENDTEAFIEILNAYLRVNRRRVAKGAHLARSTVQQALSGKGNPTLKTLAKIVHEALS
jgi:DNA-binding phage protein